MHNVNLLDLRNQKCFLSKAGSDKDDATIIILVKALKKLGYGGLKMVNLYSCITSKPWIKPNTHSIRQGIIPYSGKTIPIFFAIREISRFYFILNHWVTAFPEAEIIPTHPG